MKYIIKFSAIAFLLGLTLFACKKEESTQTVETYSNISADYYLSNITVSNADDTLKESISFYLNLKHYRNGEKLEVKNMSTAKILIDATINDSPDLPVVKISRFKMKIPKDDGTYIYERINPIRIRVKVSYGEYFASNTVCFDIDKTVGNFKKNNEAKMFVVDTTIINVNK